MPEIDTVNKECNSINSSAQATHESESMSSSPPAIKYIHLVSLICLIGIFVLIIHQIENNIKLKVENDDGDALESSSLNEHPATAAATATDGDDVLSLPQYP